jgi:hypothetical protein
MVMVQGSPYTPTPHIHILWGILTQTKPKNKIQESKNCTYSIPCKCGKKEAIQETGRQLNTGGNTEMGEVPKPKIAEHPWDDNRI